ncbi:hypothetical protein AUH73_06780 [archaeon 13_1_40CM_4_53_4]|nr:MAG: hypothetical protein AUH73_06780 [archaeon 13_1_40CM_4_53_4]OLE59646.1 MAG: hypothetical protein AUG17_01805 [Crenarchaeota archaeon 13_1_20CM_2_53_14]
MLADSTVDSTIERLHGMVSRSRSRKTGESRKILMKLMRKKGPCSMKLPLTLLLDRLPNEISKSIQNVNMENVVVSDAFHP